VIADFLRISAHLRAAGWLSDSFNAIATLCCQATSSRCQQQQQQHMTETTEALQLT